MTIRSRAARLSTSYNFRCRCEPDHTPFPRFLWFRAGAKYPTQSGG